MGYLDGNLDAEGRIKAAEERDQRIYMIISACMSAFSLAPGPRLIARWSRNPGPVDLEPLTPPRLPHSLDCGLVGGSRDWGETMEVPGDAGQPGEPWSLRHGKTRDTLLCICFPRFLPVGASEERHTKTKTHHHMPKTAHLQNTVDPRWLIRRHYLFLEHLDAATTGRNNAVLVQAALPSAALIGYVEERARYCGYTRRTACESMAMVNRHFPSLYG